MQQYKNKLIIVRVKTVYFSIQPNMNNYFFTVEQNKNNHIWV